MLTDRDPALPFCRTIAVNGHYLQDREPPAHMETDDACSHVVYLAGSPVIRATQRWTTGCHNSLERRASCCSGERSGVGADSPTGNHGRQSDRRRDSARDDVRASCREAHTAEPERKPTPWGDQRCNERGHRAWWRQSAAVAGRIGHLNQTSLQRNCGARVLRWA